MDKTITIVGSSYFSSISILLEELKKLCKKGSESATTGPINGCAASICILSAVCLESYVMRARYMHEASGKQLIIPVGKFLGCYWIPDCSTTLLLRPVDNDFNNDQNYGTHQR